MKKILSVFVSFLLFTGLSNEIHAEGKDPEPKVGSICGRVIDNTKQALPGACVYIDGLQTGDISDVNGFYSIKNIKPGNYKVVVSYVGYDPYTIELTVTEGKTTESDIVLKEGVELQEVVVVGAFSGQRKAVNMQKNNLGIPILVTH